MKIAREMLRLTKCSGETLQLDVAVPLSFSARAKGLLGRDSPGQGQGMLFAACSSVHCFGMQYPIDVVFAKRDGVVAKCVPGLRPWHVAMCLGAYYVLELGKGEIARLGIGVGDKLVRAN